MPWRYQTCLAVRRLAQKNARNPLPSLSSSSLLSASNPHRLFNSTCQVYKQCIPPKFTFFLNLCVVNPTCFALRACFPTFSQTAICKSRREWHRSKQNRLKYCGQLLELSSFFRTWGLICYFSFQLYEWIWLNDLLSELAAVLGLKRWRFESQLIV